MRYVCLRQWQQRLDGIRSDDQFHRIRSCIEENPVKAGWFRSLSAFLVERDGPPERAAAATIGRPTKLRGYGHLVHTIYLPRGAKKLRACFKLLEVRRCSTWWWSARARAVARRSRSSRSEG